VARIVELYVDLEGNRRCAIHWMYRLQVGCQSYMCDACVRCALREV
jgi:hypothetical protein